MLKYFKLNYIKMQIQNLLHAAKIALRGKLIALYSYMRNKYKSL